MRGTVYILENPSAQRVKVGMTINNAVDRLRDVNDMWLQRKVTCQICGGKLLRSGMLVPRHVVSGKSCSGGEILPLEKDITHAQLYLDKMKKLRGNVSGSERGSVTRIIKTLEKRIELYQQYEAPVGMWKLNTSFFTECAEQVELLSHEILANHLDEQAPFGEVFRCSVAEAEEAVETALGQLGLLDSARKEVKEYVTSEKFGKCSICGNNVTESGVCPECMQRFLQ